MATRTERGAYSVGDKDRKKGGGWLKWLLLALLLIGLAILLIALLSGGGKGSLKAGGESLLSDSAKLKPRVGTKASGKAIKVQEMAKSGFFVGTSKKDEVYVEYGGKTGTDESDGYHPKAGDKVDFSGPVRPAPQDPATALHLNASEAKVVTDREGFINADTVKRAS